MTYGKLPREQKTSETLREIKALLKVQNAILRELLTAPAIKLSLLYVGVPALRLERNRAELGALEADEIVHREIRQILKEEAKRNGTETQKETG